MNLRENALVTGDGINDEVAAVCGLEVLTCYGQCSNLSVCGMRCDVRPASTRTLSVPLPIRDLLCKLTRSLYSRKSHLHVLRWHTRSEHDPVLHLD
jgi:hypothetical protein